MLWLGLSPRAADFFDIIGGIIFLLFRGFLYCNFVKIYVYKNKYALNFGFFIFITPISLVSYSNLWYFGI
jgi:hypothetical protein